jgi:hypothetical protein
LPLKVFFSFKSAYKSWISSSESREWLLTGYRTGKVLSVEEKLIAFFVSHCSTFASKTLNQPVIYAAIQHKSNFIFKLNICAPFFLPTYTIRARESEKNWSNGAFIKHKLCAKHVHSLHIPMIARIWCV